MLRIISFYFLTKSTNVTVHLRVTTDEQTQRGYNNRLLLVLYLVMLYNTTTRFWRRMVERNDVMDS